MTHQFNFGKALLKPGIPDCVHRTRIKIDDHGHEIGVCVRCGRTIDYTLIQKKYSKAPYVEHSRHDKFAFHGDIII